MVTSRDLNPVMNMFRHTWKYSEGRRHVVAIVFILFTIAVAFELAIPYIIGKIFNIIQESGSGRALFRSIILYLGLFVLLRFGFWIFHGTGRVLERKNSFYVKLNYKKEVFDKVLELPPGWHRDHHSGDTIDKVNRAASGLFRFSGIMYAPIQSVILLVGAILILGFIDLRSAIIATFFTVFSIFFIYRFDKILSRLYKKQFLYENFIASAVHDFISNIITIITLRLKKIASKEVLARMLKPFRVFSKEVLLNEYKWFSVSMSVTIMTAIIIVWYAYDEITATGTVLVGTLFMLYRYGDRIGSTFFNFAARYSEIVEQNAAIVSLDPIRKAYEKVPIVEKTLRLPKNWNEIEIKSLYFSYSDKKHEKHHMENIDVILERGKKIAFIGESGSGKSTLLSLLRGLYDAKNVKVYVDGGKMEHGLRHLSEHVTLIPQEPEIFNSTIRNNITMGIKYKDAQVNEVVKLSLFGSVVRRLKRGLGSDISEKGVNLSGGEKQRLALARGLLAGEKSDLLLLDEPTSSVDSKNELNIYKNIFSNFPEKTIISSIHRLHLLKYFDYVYFFDEGKVIAEGTFSDLKKNRKFEKIWREYIKKN